MKISDIKIGKRFRKDIGDLFSLCESIKEVGLLHPIVVTSDGNLIAGLRRVVAFKKLGRDTIPHRVVASLDDALKLLKAESDENTCRKDFAPSEAVRLGLKLEALLRPGARARQALAGPSSGKGTKKTASGKLPEAVTGDTRDRVADALNMSSRTYEKAKVVVLEADKSPSKFRDVVKKMDESGNVHRAFMRVRRAQKGEAAKKAGKLPNAKYRVIYADPPWSYTDKADAGSIQGGGAEQHYAAMSIDQLCALPIRNMVSDDAVLFLWVTSPLLLACAPVINAWGFFYKASFVWDKVKHNMGHYNSVRHEFLLVCTRGSCTPDVVELFDSVQTIKRDRHSVKPERFRTIIDTLYPNGKRIELFSRKRVDGWDAWGNEA